jgi:hypothetical protein
MARPARALIIACQNYPVAQDVAAELKGTLQSGMDFFTWLVKDKGLDPANIIVCCDDPFVTDPPVTRTFKAQRPDILDAIVELCGAGRDNTSELFVFFSGHGVGWQISPQQRGLDVLLATDYKNSARSGGACIKVDELRSEMRAWLGGEDHYYFLDACRTVMKVGEIQPVDLGLTLSLAANEEPTTYVLYATKFGEAAKINSGFADALLKGLKGTGRSKERKQGQWWVRFDRVQKFVQDNVKGKTDLAQEGARQGLILKLTDPQTSPCTVTVDSATADDEFKFTVEVGGISQTFDFTGGSFQKDLTPSEDGYRFQLMKGESRFAQVDPPSDKFLDLFDPTALRFGPATRTRSTRRAIPPMGPPQAGIEIPRITAANITVRVLSATTGDVLAEPVTPPDGKWLPVKPGQYVAEIMDRGRVVRTQQIVVAPGDRKIVDLASQPDSRVQRSIIARLPKSDGLPDASETLRGPLIDQDTSMWLTILGASRLIQPPQTFSKLGPLPLATFDDLQQNGSVVYVLAGLEAQGAASVSVSRDATTRWEAMEQVPTLDGVFQLRRPLSPGPLLVSFAVPGMPPTTYASYALPNRAALIVFSVSRSGQIVTRQMLLPVYSLQQFLDPIVRERFNEESLHLVKYLASAQQLFASRQSLAPTTDEDKLRWESMLFGKWIDPLLALMAIFDAVRRGRAEANQAGLSEAVRNLTTYFGELPDVSAAAQALGMAAGAVPTGTPLLLDSLQRVPEWKKALPLKPDTLDYGSMWTSWWGAVSGPQ